MTSSKLPPYRPSGTLHPLITAAEGFPAFERLALEASDHLWLSFRIFDPTTRLRMATDVGETWIDLLRQRLNEGVKVRVLLSDFDPIVGPDLHEDSARSAAALHALEDEGDIQTMVVRHEARVGNGIRFGLWIPAALQMEKERKAMNAMNADSRNDALAHRPGLWKHLRQRSDGRIVWRSLRLPRLFPATFHQKIAVADNRAAVIGGLDIDERRYDDPNHQRSAPETWHDVALEITGEIVGDISRHIATCWNDNRLRMKAIRREQSRYAPPRAVDLASPLDPLDLPKAPTAQAKREGIRLLRTLSGQKRRIGFQFSPETLVCEVEQAHINAVCSAERAIYVETQFLRSQVIANALAETARRNPKVNLVMVLPAAPEMIAFEEKVRLPERMGEFLQSECLETIRNTFGARATVLSPVRPVASSSDGRDQLHSAEIVYLHSKVLIVDNRCAIVGSANLNGRSMRWDTEAAVECTDGEQVGKLRRAVMEHWLPEQPDHTYFQLDDMARIWAELADTNARQAPEQRRGFLVPHDPQPAKDAGMPVPAVPDELV